MEEPVSKMSRVPENSFETTCTKSLLSVPNPRCQQKEQYHLDDIYQQHQTCPITPQYPLCLPPQLHSIEDFLASRSAAQLTSEFI